MKAEQEVTCSPGLCGDSEGTLRTVVRNECPRLSPGRIPPETRQPFQAARAPLTAPGPWDGGVLACSPPGCGPAVRTGLWEAARPLFLPPGEP